MKGRLLASVEEAAEVIASGGVIVIPTETVYGLAARPDRSAVARIITLKGRPGEKSLQLLADAPERLDELGRPTPAASRLAKAWWPGPLTLVVEASDAAPQACVREGTLGIRVPGHRLALELLSRTGPLAASSANPSGQPTPPTVEEIRAAFSDGVDGYLDGGLISGRGSTVVDVTSESLVVLREGDIPEAQILRTAVTRRD